MAFRRIRPKNGPTDGWNRKDPQDRSMGAGGKALPPLADSLAPTLEL